MPYSAAYYKELLSGFIRNVITDEQVEELYRFITHEPDLYEQLMRDPDIVALAREKSACQSPALREGADMRILEQLRTYAGDHRKREDNTAMVTTAIHVAGRRWWKPVAAAVLIACIATAAIFYTGSRKAVPKLANSTPSADIEAPVTTKASVLLSDGSEISLDSIKRGLLAQQGNMQLVKMDSGHIVYRSTTGNIITADNYNTLNNPRGSSVVDILLSDGTHVWLNAGSSLTYPVAFTGKQRKVVIRGEAYFDVAPDPSSPFYVIKGGLEIKVLGTHFNVNAYDDETNIKVTLLQGAVSVSNNTGGQAKDKVVLKPGQQAIAGGLEGKTQVLDDVDTEAVVAWKQGLFNFNKAMLLDVMRQLSRWYDVEIVYQGDVKSRVIGGEMQRNLNLSEVLEGLRDIGVHCRIEGRKIIVMP